jgi:PEP-CTERM motif
LGISNYSYFAHDASNQFIFPDTSAFLGEDPTGVYAPNPVVGTLAGWRNGDAGFIGSYGTYTINLTGATAAVPEPSTTAGLLAIGFFGLHSRRRKKA